MRRVAGGEHHVIGDIDKGVDRAHAGLPNAALHLVGGGLDRHAGHFHADVPRAAVGIVDFHLEVGLHFRLVGFNLFERQIVKRCEFARDAVVTPEVGAVRHGLVVDLEEHIVQIEGLGQRRAGRSVKRGEIENFGLLRSGEEVAQTNFVGSADHAVGGDAAQLGIFDLDRLALAVPANHGAGAGDGHAHSLLQVDAAADDLLHVAAEIHLADAQLVGVRMGLHAVDNADDHLVEAAGEVFHILHLDGGHGEVIGELFQIQIGGKRHILPNPGKRKFHVRPLLIGTASGISGRRCGTGGRRPHRSAS